MYNIAIIGAGPAGIAMGVELVNAGINPEDILICEKASHDNASIRQFYPIGKDINSIYKNIELPIIGMMGFSGIIDLDEYYQIIEKALQDHNLKINFNTEVEKITNINNKFEIETAKKTYTAEYVVIASGVFSKPRRPDYAIPGKLLSKISYDIIKFQKENINNMQVLVVGGGDTASEYVQTLSQMGNQVTLSYRQDNFFRMNQLNKERLQNAVDNNGVNIILSSNIDSLEELDDKKIKVNFKENDMLIVDRIVYSLGGASPVAFMSNCGIDYDDMNVALQENNETDINKLFMIGDLSVGRKGGSIMLAFNSARNVMNKLHQKYNFPKPKDIY